MTTLPIKDVVDLELWDSSTGTETSDSEDEDSYSVVERTMRHIRFSRTAVALRSGLHTFSQGALVLTRFTLETLRDLAWFGAYAVVMVGVPFAVNRFVFGERILGDDALLDEMETLTREIQSDEKNFYPIETKYLRGEDTQRGLFHRFQEMQDDNALLFTHPEFITYLRKHQPQAVEDLVVNRTDDLVQAHLQMDGPIRDYSDVRLVDPNAPDTLADKREFYQSLETIEPGSLRLDLDRQGFREEQSTFSQFLEEYERNPDLRTDTGRVMDGPIDPTQFTSPNADP